MTKVNFDALKQSVNIADLPQWLGLEGKWINDDQWRGRCPTCNKTDRDIVITKSKSAFYCHAFKKGGDAVYLTSHCKRIGQVDAGRELTRAFLKPQQPPEEERPSQEPPAHADTPSIARDLAVVAESMTAAQLRKLADTLDAKGYDRVTFI